MTKNSNDYRAPSTSSDRALTEEEHIARAMLMGLLYHHGNGDPFYYEPDELGIPRPSSMLDANTLERWSSPTEKPIHNFVMDDTINAAIRGKRRRLIKEKDDWL